MPGKFFSAGQVGTTLCLLSASEPFIVFLHNSDLERKKKGVLG